MRSAAARALLGALLAGSPFVAARGADDTIDSSLQPARVNFSPGPQYADAVRMFQGIPGLERSPQGRLWATWYGGGLDEDHHNYVMLVTSGDDGRSWSKLKLVIDPDGDGPCRAFDPCLWHDPGGRLWLFWAQGPRSSLLATQQKRIRLWAIVTENSEADSPTWSEPRQICDGVMMNKPTVLSTGAWLLPAALWGLDGSATVVCSTDRGATWRLLSQANVPDKKDRSADEPMIVERGDGSLWMLIRTHYGIGQSISTDRGHTWSVVQPSPIRHATARFFIRRLNSGKLLLVKHGPMDKRTRRLDLTAYVSDDEGKSWHGQLVLDERLGVSYPDGVQRPDGTIYIIYDYSRHGAKQILMTTFTEADVLAGRFVSQGARTRVQVNRATGVKPAG